MDDHWSEQEKPDVSAEERQSTELIKRVRKLRWIGMDEEADRIVRSQVSHATADTVFAIPPDTD